MDIQVCRINLKLKQLNTGLYIVKEDNVSKKCTALIELQPEARVNQIVLDEA